MIKFGNTVIYIDDVEKTINFYKETFGFQCKFITEDKNFAELETGETSLSFASHYLAKDNFTKDYVSVTDSVNPLGIEITLVTDDVTGLHDKALNNGAEQLRAPHEKPWGQWVSHVRCPSGILIEFCNP